MPARTIFAVTILWMLSLLAVGTLAKAQVYRLNPLPEPKVVSGPDFGIRIEAERNGTLVGPLVIRVNGQWIEVELGSLSPRSQLFR